MRLTPAQIDTIKSTAQAVLGEGVQVTLFGSRVHEIKKAVMWTCMLKPRGPI